MSLESAYNTVEKLAEDFKNNEKHYLAPDYSESQARLDFIDKFFTALGWDVNHAEQKNPYEQEVKVERKVRDKEAQKRADYAFFLKPNYRDPKFFVEAKKPSRSLANPYDYFQAIRYGWNAQTPLVILTDFEEFHIIDSRYKPNIKDSLNRKVFTYHYSEFKDKEKFSKVYFLFSREAVETGAIEKYAADMPKPRGKAKQKGLFPGAYQSIDESFLEELDVIRDTLARAFKKKNPNLGSEELTEAVQRTIDRLVFIRFIEDMLIEGEHHISSYGDKNSAWQDFINDSKGLNAKYNGVVFRSHIIDSVKFNPPEDKDFADICEELSHINSPYNFNAIPIHILGSIYERFLGKVVHATDKRVTIEEKPEVRKAGGVYYTPQYIVQYIVDNTVGKLIEGKTPKEISKLRFADISCGSGSFLITVYDTLLRYHSKWYQANPKEAKQDGCLQSEGLWVLSLKQKREILLNNVYGVDIDSQAVEVTQLSLYLKLLEDESEATANEMQSMFKERILPDLSKNIICGNSLIGTDISDGNMFPGEEEKKINAMNFEDAFPEIMKNGGFEAIVGNPPYVVVKGGRYTEFEESKIVIDYYKNKYNTLQQQINMYVAFLELGFYEITKNGYLGMVIPNTFITNDYCQDIRKFFLTKSTIKVLDNEGLVFAGAVVEALVFITMNKLPNENNVIKAKYNEVTNDILQSFYKDTYLNRFLIHLDIAKISLLKRMKNKTDSLGILCYVWRGLTTGDDKKYLSNIKKNRNFKKIIQGKQISRYYIEDKELYVNYLPEELDRARPQYIFEKTEKIISKFVGKDLAFSFDKTQLFVINTACLIFNKDSTRLNILYILGILNSKLLNFYFNELFTDYRDAFPIMKSGHLEQLPIKHMNLNDNQEKSQHDKMVNLVDQMLEAKKQLATANTDKDKNFYDGKCNSLDRQIDRLVYELYGLTEEEIKIVEG